MVWGTCPRIVKNIAFKKTGGNRRVGENVLIAHPLDSDLFPTTVNVVLAGYTHKKIILIEYHKRVHVNI